MIDIDPAILCGYILGFAALFLGLAYSLYAARRG